MKKMLQQPLPGTDFRIGKAKFQWDPQLRVWVDEHSLHWDILDFVWLKQTATERARVLRKGGEPALFDYLNRQGKPTAERKVV